MFIVILDYLVDLDEIDASLDDHAGWLRKNYESGLFLASGRREPRVGGVIFEGGDRSQVDAAVAEDPFAARQLARHTVIEFHPSAFGAALDDEAVQAALA
ncbi:YciI family protein [Conexibacter sp. DBS9H8]|uniref:YciI family protein n=1 Tax=Conexibacter sp. DBS9H8 TaxID=2937801 RepID=UPI00200E8B08|nr:YciI family protein [Conexibacter sp. DBS9H8]